MNAAQPLVTHMSEEDRKSIKAVIIGSESGLDFGKSLATYVRHYLGLPEEMRCFEIKQACYAATAALQVAASLVTSSPDGGRVLVVATDVSMKPVEINSGDAALADQGIVEPAVGSGAVAMFVGDRPSVLALDPGAHGVFGFEVADTCRPVVGGEMGAPSTSLLAYLDALIRSYEEYERVVGVNLEDAFSYLVFHTPFPGMVIGAHRHLIRKKLGWSSKRIAEDLQARVAPSIEFGAEVGNLYSGALYLGLCSLLEHGNITTPVRIGMYSYGSGCCAEFFSGVISGSAAHEFRSRGYREQMESRKPLTVEQFDSVSAAAAASGFGARNHQPDTQSSFYRALYRECFEGHGLLALREVRELPVRTTGAKRHESYRTGSRRRVARESQQPDSKA